MAERKSAKAAAGSSAQTSSDLPLQGTHTQAHTHSQQLPSDRPLSALRSFLMQCLCSRIAIPPYSDLVCFFNYLSPPSETLLPYLIEKITVGSITYTGC